MDQGFFRILDCMDPIELLHEAKKVVGEFRLSEDGLSAGSVAAAILSASGRVYTGICIDVHCGIGFCAEHAALASMLKERETRIVMAVAVDGSGVILPPCGRCREFMLQIDRENGKARIMVGRDKIVALSGLMPYYWKDAYEGA